MSKPAIKRYKDRTYSYVGKCRDCGAECSYQGKKSRCRDCAAAERASQVKAAEVVSITIIRCDCGGVIRNPRSLRCRECYYASNAKVRRTRRNCETCGRSWLSKDPDARFCRGKCERINRLGLLAFIKAPQGPKRVRGTCGTCGGSCEKFVCDPCKREVVKMHRRIDKNRRRGARAHEKYDRREIADRDGWLCHLCGGSVPKHLWGHHSHPDAPVLDHVIPIKLKGPDIASNVKLAHRSCNGKKGARLLAEKRRPQRVRREGNPQAA